MKKIYSTPALYVREICGRDALLQSVSGSNGLEGTTFSNDGTEGVQEADVKGLSDTNIWDNEW